MESPGTAQIHDFASYRQRLRSQRRARSGERRQFLWSSPATGQLLAVDFPFSTAKPVSSLAQVR
jgi:hypothetical protein